ncbi:hypothetical protein G7Y89_g7127 [Cudoniella acicularis]|uniref:Uncharacterized protein n=1 Tax=Cudoniella acicularis TaxID=354080 RepID=A0A8H4RJ51_9HELO|nr:hypothetical protein G7Y89_g7127 [Cudoniella acicularis]
MATLNRKERNDHEIEFINRQSTLKSLQTKLQEFFQYTQEVFKDQPTPENLRVIPPAREAPSKTPPTRESPKTLPQFKGPSEEQPPTNSPSEDPKPVENLTVTLPTREAPSKAPPAKEPLTTLSHLGSPSKGQPTTEAQAGDRQTAEGPTTNQQAEKALEDMPASASLPNGRSATDSPITNLPDGEIPKKLREMTIIDLTGIDSEDKSEPSASDSHYRPSLLPEFEIVSGDFDTSALLDSVDATDALLNSLPASTSKAPKDESTSRRKAYQPRPHMPVNEDTSTSSNDSNDDIINVTSAKRLSNSSKRSFKIADNEVDDHAISHKRPKASKDTTLLNSQINPPQDIRASDNSPKAKLQRKTRSRFSGPSEQLLDGSMTGEQFNNDYSCSPNKDEMSTVYPNADHRLLVPIMSSLETKGSKPRRNSPRNTAKSSFKDFVVNDSLWIGKICK